MTSQMRKQLRLLDYSEQSGIPFSEVLAHAGWTYNDLRYTVPAAPPPLNDYVLELDDVRLPFHGVQVVSFFAGAGGLDLGMEAAGFENAACIEREALPCTTLRRNRPDWHVIGPPDHSGDVDHFENTGSALSGLIDSPFSGVFVGGPPCQSFSPANDVQSGFSDPERGNLLFSYVRYIREFRPKAFVIENVPGMATIDGGAGLRAALSLLAADGYRMARPFVLDASRFGVPQMRKRVFIVGRRDGGVFRPPVPTPHRSLCGKILARPIVGDTLTCHAAFSVRRFMQCAAGAAVMVRRRRNRPRQPAYTVLGGGSGGVSLNYHPYFPRQLTVRESASLQSFPASYVFEGAASYVLRQIGNAVPPVWAAQIGAAIYRSYF